MLAQFMLCILLATVPAEGQTAKPVTVPASQLTDDTKRVPTEGASAKPAADQKIQLIAIEKAIVEETNAQRARHGLPALVVDENLMKSARQHTIWMARSRLLQHSRGVAENIAMGYTTTKAALGGWMGSSGHRANILNRSYRHIGVAAYQSNDGNVYWCQQFRW